MPLEYQSQNSLISYPFKASTATGSVGTPVADDWFLDILFCSYDPAVRSVYLSEVVKGAINFSFTFSDTETDTPLPVVTFPISNLSSHLESPISSFLGFSCSQFAVKIVLGPGLVAENQFSQAYDKDRTTLVAAAFISLPPSVSSLAFERYTSTPNGLGGVTFDLTTEKLYEFPVVPHIQTRYNSEYTHPGLLSAGRGQGQGIYPICPDAGQEVLTINRIAPQANGKLFLAGSDCHSIVQLTDARQTELSTLGLLDDYHLFTAERTAGPVILDVVLPDHSILLTNHCSAKCPPSSLQAFAHYMNRVTDGAKELNDIVFKSKRTQGLSTFSESILSVASGDFCVSGLPFVGCAEITCDNKFIKYFHEFRTLQIYYGPGDIQNYTILTVIDENTVELDRPPHNSPQPKLPFMVQDTGVLSNMNCVALSYNQDAVSYKRPYFKVKHTTSEAYNSSGLFFTFLLVSIGVFNPSDDDVQLHLVFAPTVLVRQGDFKIRRGGEVTSVSDAVVDLACRGHAFVEAIYAIPCETLGGELNIQVFDVSPGNIIPVQLGGAFNITGVEGAACPGTTSGSSGSLRVLRSEVNGSFTHTITLDTSTTDVLLYGDQPDWLDATPDYLNHTLTLTDNATAPGTLSHRFAMYYRSTGAGTSVSKFTLDFVAPPTITSPLESRYGSSSPLFLSKTTVYTSDSPALQVFATNMSKLSNDFPSDLTDFYFSMVPSGITTALPTGLTFNTTTGKLTGQVAAGVVGGTNFEYFVSAHNPAGDAVNGQTITLTVAAAIVPTLEFAGTSSPFTLTNVQVFTADEPLFELAVTGQPIFNFALSGVLPEGLAFSTFTGRITGRITELTLGSANLSITATNAYGTSAPLPFTLDYTLLAAPVVTYPTTGQLILDTYAAQVTTLGAPLLTITSTQALGGSNNYASGLTDQTRNRYTAAGLPDGYTLDLYTGKIYGQISSGELPLVSPYTKIFTVRVDVSNPIGKASTVLQLRLSSAALPSVLSPAAGTTRPIERGKTYTPQDPFIQIKASGTPTSFSATGLPTGLSCTPAGQIVGRVADDIPDILSSPAGNYTVTITATNTAGTSAPVSMAIYLPLLVYQPAPQSSYNVNLGKDEVVVQLRACPTVAAVPVTITATGLPPGLYTDADGFIRGLALALGSTDVSIVATATGFQPTYSKVTLTVVPESYEVSGTIFDGVGAPVVGAEVTEGRKTVYTDENGKFELLALVPGEYNITAYKEGVTFVPRYRQVSVVSIPIVEVDFQADGPYRQVSGFVHLAEGVALPGVAVEAGSHSGETGTSGLFQILANRTPLRVMPQLLGYNFVPPYIDLPAGNTDEETHFLALEGPATGAPIITGLTAEDRRLLVNFTVPEDDGTILYEYSTDGGTIYQTETGPLISNILGLDKSLQVNYKVEADEPTTQYKYSINGGNTFSDSQ